MKTLLKNCKIYDGTGSEPYFGEVLLEGDKIAQVGADLGCTDAQRILDLQGRCLAPGFIDGHSHNDWFAIKRDPVPYFSSFLRQGITTYVAGNCGLSAIGFEENCPHIDKIGGGLFGYRDTTGTYGSASAFFGTVDRNAPGNMLTLVGHCSARAAVAGYENRPLTEEEMTDMLAILEKALEEGAAGISLGLMYEPGLYAQLEELKQVAELCVKHNKILTVHPRASSAVSMSYPELLGRSHLLRALDEIVEIAKGTNLKLQYSHAIFVGRRSFKDAKPFLAIMDQLRKDGVDAGFDIYNELEGVSVITVILPAWYQSMTPQQKRNPINKLKLSVLVKASSLLLGFGFDDIQIAYIGPGYEEYEGKTVHQIAKETGRSDLSTYLDLCEKSNFCGRVNMGPYSTPEIIRQFTQHPHCTYMTDAWTEEHGIQNPSSYDCYPSFLRDAFLGNGASVAMTVRKMTGAIADRFMIPQRGYLKPGCFADLTVFDETGLLNGNPALDEPFGIDKVFINGQLVLDEGRIDEALFRTCGRAVPIERKS